MWEEELKKRWYLHHHNKELDHFVTCGEEVVPVHTGVTMEQALLEHARKQTAKAKRTTVTPIRHNAIQIMQDFGEHTYSLAHDSWDMWNKGKEYFKDIDRLTLGIINVFVLTWIAKNNGRIQTQDIAGALYQDSDYLKRLVEQRALPVAKKLSISQEDMIAELLEVCVHPPLKKVLQDYAD